MNDDARARSGRAVHRYRLAAFSGQTPFAGDRALRDQMRRSAVSIPSNIAEGSERGTDKEATRFFHIAKGSAAVLMTQAEIAAELDLLTTDAGQRIVQECGEIANMLGGLIVHRQRA